MATIIKDHPIENIPDTVPTRITRAFVTLSDQNFAFDATVTAVKPETAPVPLPFLGEITIDASYTWGESSAFTLAVQILVGLLPSPASKHQVTATLLGQLEYDSRMSSWNLQASLEGFYAID